MIVTASRHGESDYAYNTISVVLITEALKLLLSTLIYIRDKTAISLGEGVLSNKSVFFLYSKCNFFVNNLSNFLIYQHDNYSEYQQIML